MKLVKGWKLTDPNTKDSLDLTERDYQWLKASTSWGQNNFGGWVRSRTFILK